jgi:flavorubredoxin
MHTNSIKINDWLQYVGVNDRTTALFENMWPLEEGIAYNSFVIKAEKTALLDTVKVDKVDNFLQKLDDALDGRTLDYIVLHHMEPDHSSALKIVLQRYPDAQLVGNKKTFEFLEGFYGFCKNTIVVGEGDELDLGGRKLQFFRTAMVHWPESMVSYEPESKTLFSQDAFGSYGALNGGIFDDEINWDFFEPEARRYYANIVGKYSRQVQIVLKKLSGLEINMICPVHGVIWRKNPAKIVSLYDKWSSFTVEEGVIIVYASMYGNTAIMAEAIARGLAEEGIKNIKVYDVSTTHNSYILSEMYNYKGLILGSCSYANSLFPVMEDLVYTLELNKIENHILGIFGCYSWSGGALERLTEFAENCKYELVEATANAKHSPNADDLADCREIARQMAEKLKSSRS